MSLILQTSRPTSNMARLLLAPMAKNRVHIIHFRQNDFSMTPVDAWRVFLPYDRIRAGGEPGSESGVAIMTLMIRTDSMPLRIDEHGVARVGDSQVLLDIVIREFNNGAEPETIAHGYPTLDLADVYGSIAYYLRHRQEIDAYLHTRQQEAEKLRRDIEAKQPDRAELRAKLLARKARMELAHASPAKR